MEVAAAEAVRVGQRRLDARVVVEEEAAHVHRKFSSRVLWRTPRTSRLQQVVWRETVQRREEVPQVVKVPLVVLEGQRRSRQG